MNANRLIVVVAAVCFLALSVGPMFAGGTTSAFAAQQMKKSTDQQAVKAAMKPAVKAHKKRAKKVMMSETVLEVQKALNSAGFKLSEDGLMGKKTRQALKRYQKDNDLKVTGKADTETLEKLGIKQAPKA